MVAEQSSWRHMRVWLSLGAPQDTQSHEDVDLRLIAALRLLVRGVAGPFAGAGAHCRAPEGGAHSRAPDGGAHSRAPDGGAHFRTLSFRSLLCLRSLPRRRAAARRSLVEPSGILYL